VIEPARDLFVPLNRANWNRVLCTRSVDFRDRDKKNAFIGVIIGPCGDGDAHEIDRKPDMSEFEPDIADEAPWSDEITPYDEAHFVTYLRLLDAEVEGADWREATHIVLRRDPAAESDGARRCWESHLKRAKWMTEHGYRHLLEGARNG
jgi:hypothetical protein